MIAAVFFDLDGTLLDTAPDLTWAINQLRTEHALPPVSLASIRQTVSHGTPGMLKAAFGLDPQHPNFPPLRKRLLEIYQEHLAFDTALFPGIPEVLDSLEKANIPWGIVTNKPGFLTNPLMERLGLAKRAQAIVSGDTTPFAKPHPAPLFHACALAGCVPQQCVYVGDAERDVIAGRAAGMQTIVALFGYLAPEDQPQNWGAEACVETPQALLNWILY